MVVNGFIVYRCGGRAAPNALVASYEWDHLVDLVTIGDFDRVIGDIPSGYVETAETPAQAAAHEVREDLGIEATVRPLLVVDWAPHPMRAINSCSSSTAAR